MMDLKDINTPHPGAVTFEAMVDEKGFMTGYYNCVANDDNVDHSNIYYPASVVAGLVELATEVGGSWRAFETELRESIGNTNYAVIEGMIASALAIAPVPQDDVEELRAALMGIIEDSYNGEPSLEVAKRIARVAVANYDKKAALR